MEVVKLGVTLREKRELRGKKTVLGRIFGHKREKVTQA